MLKRKDDPFRSKAAKRLSRLSESEILDWADSASRGLADALSDYRRYHDQSALSEALQGVSTIGGALDVLVLRS